ncbi:MAG TPA: oligoribonuclease, partial [Desulfatiglandales bacterium]|nr:oligoribonuclease [Desulfatiglandales bacterium]
LEMTGLDPEKDSILEIATVVTDYDLEVVAEGPNIAINQPEEIISSMDEWNMTHHKESGLLDRVKASSCDCQNAAQKTLEFISTYCKKKKSPLCGNSVWQDRRFLKKHMPGLEEFFHYRNIDVSTIKELVRRWYPSLPSYKKQKAHLALKDIKESINELIYYRRKVFLE